MMFPNSSVTTVGEVLISIFQSLFHCFNCREVLISILRSNGECMTAVILLEQQFYVDNL